MMISEPIFLNPIFKEKIWGGNKLKELFDYTLPFEQTGECWGVSSHKNDISNLRGKLSGLNLKELWELYPTLFGENDFSEFPLLMKLIDASEDLSVQVHPNNNQALKLENYPYGKNEWWYILDCDKDAKIVYGHNARDKKEFDKLLTDNNWTKLLRHKKVNPGDFFYVPSGTIHAIGKGVRILEIQQNCDITYRFFDYDRGRELDLEKATEVIQIPQPHILSNGLIFKRNDIKITLFVSEFEFDIEKWEVEEKTSKIEQNNNCRICFVISGTGEIIINEKSFSYKKGDFIIIPATIDSFELIGTSEWIVTYLKKE